MFKFIRIVFLSIIGNTEARDRAELLYGMLWNDSNEWSA